VSELWTPPSAEGRIDAVVDVPGSKSVTNRLLVLAALADGPTALERPLVARDTQLMADAIRALGVSVTGSDTEWLVTPGPLRGPAVVDCGLAGTVMRFVPPLATLAAGPVAFDGDPRARERPMAPLLDALRAVGARIDDGGRGRLPFTVHGDAGVAGGAITVDAEGSSQFVSALLLAGCRFAGGLELTAVGHLPSLPHVEMTVHLLRQVGIHVDRQGSATWCVHPGTPRAGRFLVPPDLSNAAPFLAACLLAGGCVRVPGWRDAAIAQPGDAIRSVLRDLGATDELEPDGTLALRGRGEVRGLDVDLGALPELVTTVAALAAVADAPTTIRGVGHLRGHETDRLAALATELNLIGGDVTETEDGLVVRPRPLRGGVFHTYADHRMATAGALLGLVVPGLMVEDVETTGKTLPDFTGRWSRLLGASAA
jgi:3-phosphoshikimate 1-carboxyvinyltransferase